MIGLTDFKILTGTRSVPIMSSSMLSCAALVVLEQRNCTRGPCLDGVLMIIENCSENLTVKGEMTLL